MIGHNINKFVDNFNFIEHNYNLLDLNNKETEIVLKNNQIEMIKLIHQQFQIPTIKNLYKNPKFRDRVFWVVYGNIYLQNENIGMDELTSIINKYLKEQGLK